MYNFFLVLRVLIANRFVTSVISKARNCGGGVGCVYVCVCVGGGVGDNKPYQ